MKNSPKIEKYSLKQKTPRSDNTKQWENNLLHRKQGPHLPPPHSRHKPPQIKSPAPHSKQENQKASQSPEDTNLLLRNLAPQITRPPHQTPNPNFHSKPTPPQSKLPPPHSRRQQTQQPSQPPQDTNLLLRNSTTNHETTSPNSQFPGPPQQNSPQKTLLQTLHWQAPSTHHPQSH